MGPGRHLPDERSPRPGARQGPGPTADDSRASPAHPELRQGSSGSVNTPPLASSAESLPKCRMPALPSAGMTNTQVAEAVEPPGRSAVGGGVSASSCST